MADPTIDEKDRNFLQEQLILYDEEDDLTLEFNKFTDTMDLNNKKIDLLNDLRMTALRRVKKTQVEETSIVKRQAKLDQEYEWYLQWFSRTNGTRPALANIEDGNEEKINVPRIHDTGLLDQIVKEGFDEPLSKQEYDERIFSLHITTFHFFVLEFVFETYK